MSADVATRGGRRATVARWVLFAGLFALVAFVTLPRDTGVPLDPRSPGAAGTAALVDLLDEVGVRVSIGGRVPDDRATVVLVLADHLADAQRDALADFVADGGRLVLTDPGSILAEVDESPFVTDQIGALAIAPGCDLLDTYVDRVASATWWELESDAATETRCFPLGNTDGLLVQRRGAGRVVIFGGADAFTNAHIGERSHARLAVALLAPNGSGRVTVLWDRPEGPFAPGFGEQSLLDVVPTGARAAIGLLALAAALYGWSRARRHGAPVEEVLPVRVPGSELVVALGELLQRHGSAADAARRIREDARAAASRALALPRDTPTDVLAEVYRARIGGSRSVDLVFGDELRNDDDWLAELAAAVAAVRRALDEET